VHNVIPGPNLFQNELDFVYALYVAMLLLNVIVIVFLIFSTNLLTKVIQIPTRFLGMIILVLSFVGVYSLRNSVTDCAIASAFGILGLILKRLNLPIVPIILGMVLGGIMEVKLRSSLIRVKDPLDMVERPIAAIIAVMILLVILLHIRTLVREYRARLAEGEIDHDLHDTQQR
jgi:putative tricarboxylic transport membrane protein